jgi:hypothetical protein
MTTMLDTPTIAPAFTLSITKVATIADFEGPRHRYYVRNFTLVGKVAV